MKQRPSLTTKSRAWAIGYRRWMWWVGAAVVVSVVALLVWWPRAQQAPRRARQYKAFTSCLLTDQRGVSAGPGATVWAGMQDASLTTLTKVRFLSVVGPQTVENARTFLASLAQSKCELVIAVGTLPDDAVAGSASTFPDVQFVVVGSESSAVNVRALTEENPALLRAQISGLVSAASKHAK